MEEEGGYIFCDGKKGRGYKFYRYFLSLANYQTFAWLE